MAISINLLPDVRLARLRDERRRHMVLGVSVMIWVLVGVVVGGLLITYSVQKIQLDLLNKGIASDSAQIQAIPALNEALTAQQATTSLASLYSGRSYFSHFVTLLVSRLPVDVTIASLQEGQGGALTVACSGKSIYALNKFVDSLKQAGPTATDVTSSSIPTVHYFSNVVMAQISKDDSGKATTSFTATINEEAFHGQN